MLLDKFASLLLFFRIDVNKFNQFFIDKAYKSLLENNEPYLNTLFSLFVSKSSVFVFSLCFLWQPQLLWPNSKLDWIGLCTNYLDRSSLFITFPALLTNNTKTLNERYYMWFHWKKSWCVIQQNNIANVLLSKHR